LPSAGALPPDPLASGGGGGAPPPPPAADTHKGLGGRTLFKKRSRATGNTAVSKNYGNFVCAAIVAALPGCNKQTLKSQMRD